MSTRLAVIASLVAFGAPRVAAAADQVLVHQLAESSAAGRPDATITLHPVRAALVTPRGAHGGAVAIDEADYTRAGTLTLGVQAAVRTAAGETMIPAGEYALDFQVAGAEPPILVVRAADGRSLRVPLAAAPRPAGAVLGLRGESLSDGAATGSWPVAFHLPTASGLLLLAPGPSAAPATAPAQVRAVVPSPQAPLPPRRRSSRAEILQDRLQTRRRADDAPHAPRVPATPQP